MRLSDLPIGDGVRRRIKAAVDRLSHAYIISGPSKPERLALARHLAAAYVCTGEGERPCGVCPGCRKAEGEIHPDIIRLTVLEGKRDILVEQIRRLRADAYIRPNEAVRKVFLIEDAQAMNENAQNALLKVLEEGPSYLSFLFLTEHPQQLLSTIRSRCETLSLVPLNEESSIARDEELQKMAVELANLLSAGNELALVENMVALENRKWDKDTLPVFLDGVENALRPQLHKHPEQMLPLMERLRQVRQAVPFNVGAGHLFGWLTTGL